MKDQESTQQNTFQIDNNCLWGNSNGAHATKQQTLEAQPT